MVCPNCGSNIPAGATTCNRCGTPAPAARYCPHCHASIPLNAVVCPVCEELVHRTTTLSAEPHESTLQTPEPESRSAAHYNTPRPSFHWIYIIIAIMIFSLGFMLGSITTSRPIDESATNKSASISQQNELTSLDGLWKQVNSASETSYFAAGISGNSIEIVWADTEADTQSLYWAGTVDLPDGPSSEFVWESVNDISKTDGAMMASSNERKSFTYKDGQLSFNAAVMGTTTLVKMKKVSDTPPNMSSAVGPSTEPTPSEPQEPSAPSLADEGGVPGIGSDNDGLYAITYQTCNVYEDSSGQVCCDVIIEVENTSQSNLYLGSPIFDFEDKAGKLIGTCNFFAYGSSDPEIIAPGEKGYFYSNGYDIEGILTPDMDYVFVPHLDIEKSNYNVARYDVTDLSISKGDFGPCTIVGKVTNNTTEDDSLVWICCILFNSNDEPIGIYGTNITDLAAGKTTSFSASALPVGKSISYEDISAYKVFAVKKQWQF